MSDLFRFVAEFVGVTLMAIITASTIRIVCEMVGPEGVERIRETRERQDRPRRLALSTAPEGDQT